MESVVQSNVDIIEAYFMAVGNVLNYQTTGGNNQTYFALPLSAGGHSWTEVRDAGGAIGAYIDANHCVSEPN